MEMPYVGKRSKLRRISRYCRYCRTTGLFYNYHRITLLKAILVLYQKSSLQSSEAGSVMISM